MEHELATLFDLETRPEFVTCVDNIKIFLNFDKFIDFLKEYEPISGYEHQIKKIYGSPFAQIRYLLSQNHMDNWFGSISFVLSNPFSIDTHKFDAIYNNMWIFDRMANKTKEIWNTLVHNKKISNFYNKDLVNKFIQVLNFTPVEKEKYLAMSKAPNLDKEIKWAQYNDACDNFINASMSVKQYMESILNSWSNDDQVPGCYNFENGAEFYKYCLQCHTGLDINIDIDKIQKWGLHQLDKLVSELKVYLEMIGVDCDDSIENIIKNYKPDTFKSKDDFVKEHFNVLNKYTDVFIGKYNFPNYINVQIVVFDDLNLAGGYYSDDTFYLNVANWKETPTFEVEPLVLHETIPGHHTQIHASYHNPDNQFLLENYFPELLNGFAEGWGLFSESLGVNQTIYDKIGTNQYEMLRVLRIIVDIDIHYRGQSPTEIIKFMKKYLAIPEGVIIAETYRYYAIPGQALCYRLGSHVISKLFIFSDRFHPENIDKCKELILNGPKLLKNMLNNKSENDLFNYDIN